MSKHITDSALSALLDGSLSQEEARSTLEHVEKCEHCRSRVAWSPPMASIENTLDAQSRDYSAVVDRVFEVVLDESRTLESQRSTGARLVLELRALSLNQRRLVVKNSSQYQTWAIAEQLLLECRAGWSESPSESEALASLALDVIDRLDAHGFRVSLLSDLKSEAWSYVANCRRIQFQLKGATEAFQEAEAFLEKGSGDLIENARLLDLKASYFCTSGQFDAAADALSQAIRSYRAAGDAHLEGRALLKYTKVLYDSGRIEDAMPALEKACGLVDTTRDPYLEFMLKWTKLLYLTRLGETEEACRLLPTVRELARERAPRLERLRFLWTEAILRRRLGQVELAEEALKQVREGYIAAEIPADVALVSLELAGLFLELGRTEEVRRLAIETMPLFASRGVQRELLMAWSLFQQAAEQDSATVQLVGELATRIRRIQARRPDSDVSTA